MRGVESCDSLVLPKQLCGYVLCICFSMNAIIQKFASRASVRKERRGRGDNHVTASKEYNVEL